MKKLQKFLAILLAVSMCMSLLCIGASAAGPLFCLETEHSHEAGNCQLHDHSAACFATGCDMNETTPYYCDKTVHAHGDGNCNAEVCGKTAHVHGDGNCNGEICGLTAHSHDGVSCNDENCDRLEHTHGDGKCDSACTLIGTEGHDCTAGGCEMSDCSLEVHAHNANCCAQDAHAHDATCCTQEEHTHDADCCSLTEYAHTSGCYHTHTAWGEENTCYTVKTCDWEQDECMLKEHTHTEADCYAADDDVAMIAGKGAYATLAEAVTAANADAAADTIILLANITMDAGVSITHDTTINGNGKTITRTAPETGTFSGTLFTVAANKTLTLDGGLVIDGGNNWTFDSEGYYADMADHLLLKTGAKSSYTASAEGGFEATTPMISITANGAVVMNSATIQNNWGSTHNDGGLFKVPAGATLTMNNGALIKHIHSSVAGQVSGAWTMNGGKIDDVYGHNTNGGLVDLRNSGVLTINGGEITNVRTLGLNANGNGILVQSFNPSTKVYINGGNIHGNASFSPGGGWGAVIYLNGRNYPNAGSFKMTGGTIKDNKSDICTAFVANNYASIELLGGTMEVNTCTTPSYYESQIAGMVTVGKEMNIISEDGSRFVMVGNATNTLEINGNISGEGTMWLMESAPITGEGTITSNVLVKTHSNYPAADVTLASADWNCLITVDSVGSGASLTVQPGANVTKGLVRVLDSVASGNYLNKDESAAEQAAAFVKEAGANVTSPVLFYHRLTSDQKQNVVVTFDYNGGLDASGWSGCQLTGAEAFAPALPAPTRGEDYKLIGWAYAKEKDPESLSMESDAAYDGETITESVRLIAQWKEPDYVCYIKETNEKYETLREAVADANTLEGANIIVMVKNINFDSTEALSVTGDLTIVGEKTISRGAYTGTLFTVPAGSSLTLDGGIVFDGNNDWTFNKELFEEDLYARNSNKGWATYATSEEGGTKATAPMFVVNGTMTAKDVTVQNSYSDKGNNNDGNYAIIRVNAGGTLTTNGATFSHITANSCSTVVGLNSATWNIMGDTLITGIYAGRNGGITRNNSGTINMSGGTIKDNYGYNTNGTVFMMYGGGTLNAAKQSKFIMTGGTVCGNASIAGVDNGRCASVYLHDNSYMKMTGGIICHNIGGARGGIDCKNVSTMSVLDINRVDQYFVDGVYPNENGKDAYTAEYHPMVVDNISLSNSYKKDVGNNDDGSDWWVTGGIYTQDVDDFCAEGYICIPYVDSEREDDYIVVPGYRVKYYAVEKTESTNAETGEVTVDYTNTLVQKYFHMLPRDKFWYEMDDEHAVQITVTDDAGRVINTWYTEQELVNLYNFNSQLESDLNLYGQWRTSGGGGGGGGPIVTPIIPTIPEDPTEFVDIEEEDVPLTDLPEEAEEILDDEVPLAVPPKTGDASALWMALSALSGAGLFLVRKKREED